MEEKGLPEDSADKIGKLVTTKGEPMEVLRILQQERSPYVANAGSMSALKDLDLLFHYLQSAKCLHRISFDLSLARGLDYYTGVIYEAVFKGSMTVRTLSFSCYSNGYFLSYPWGFSTTNFFYLACPFFGRVVPGE